MKKSSLVLWFLLFGALGVATYSMASPCDLNNDGRVDDLDYRKFVNMYLKKIPCTANINGPGVCNIVTSGRIMSAILGQECQASSGSHYVTLGWDPSTSQDGGGYCCWYNIRRGTVSGGPYTTLLNPSPISVLTFIDLKVTGGTTDYYVVTAVDVNGVESAFSNEVKTSIPP